jgi:hypothetical protein
MEFRRGQGAATGTKPIQSKGMRLDYQKSLYRRWFSRSFESCIRQTARDETRTATHLKPASSAEKRRSQEVHAKRKSRDVSAIWLCTTTSLPALNVMVLS